MASHARGGGGGGGALPQTITRFSPDDATMNNKFFPPSPRDRKFTFLFIFLIGGDASACAIRVITLIAGASQWNFPLQLRALTWVQRFRPFVANIAILAHLQFSHTAAFYHQSCTACISRSNFKWLFLKRTQSSLAQWLRRFPSVPEKCVFAHMPLFSLRPWLIVISLYHETPILHVSDVLSARHHPDLSSLSRSLSKIQLPSMWINLYFIFKIHFLHSWVYLML